MKYLRDFSRFMEELIGINQEYIFLIILSLLSFFVIKIILVIIKKILKSFDSKTGYLIYQRCRLILTILNILIIFILWDTYLDNIITIISFISAALTLALREIIFNFFAGIYIKIKKPFNVDDRIELGNIKGDVIAINTFDFEVLEVGDYINGEQSTGKVVNVPNSEVLSHPVKNYAKNFKYIWNEIVVKTPLDVNIEEVKSQLYVIVNNNEIIKRIPAKMRQIINQISIDNRIYYNKLEPIIYLKVVDSHIEFYIRYLIHPKKNRIVEDDIYTKILVLHNEGKIKLYVE